MDQPILRLYLVRHGETQANIEGKVVGHWDSPLTESGIESAKALGRSEWLRRADFWKIYSSDLIRARITSQLVLSSAAKDDGSVIFDERLREIAKGARQGFSKHMSHDEAIKARRELQMHEEPLPLLETEEDGWNRARAWLNQLIQDVVQDYSTRKGCSPETDNHDDEYTVLAVAHAGLVRIFLRRLLGDDRLYQHPDAKFEPDMNNRFKIPNTSLTILEIRPRVRNDGQAMDVPKDQPLENVDIIQLTWTGHCTNVKEQPTTSNNR